MACNPYI